ncbi:hypothetical protein ES705_45131 [subsurface metagenome]
MHTNINIDDIIIYKALKYANVKTENEIILIALKEYIENHSKINASREKFLQLSKQHKVILPANYEFDREKIHRL